MRQRSPQEVEISRAGTGAGLITAMSYLCLAGRHDIGSLAAVSIEAPARVPAIVWMAFGGLPLLFATGALLFFVGASRAAGPRDLILATKSLAWTVPPALLLSCGVYMTGAPELNACLEAAYLWWLASSVTKLLLSLRGMPTQSLPDPETMPDFPMSGPASPEAAQEGMSGENGWMPPKFKS